MSTMLCATIWQLAYDSCHMPTATSNSPLVVSHARMTCLDWNTPALPHCTCSSALPSAAAREEITAVPFEQLAEQLQDCTRMLSMQPLQGETLR